MKVILNEEQIREIVSAEMQGNMLYESLMSKEDISELRNAIKKAVRNGVASMVIIAAIARLSVPQDLKTLLQNDVKIEMQQMANDSTNAASSHKIEPLIKCIGKYIGAQGHKIAEIKFSPEHLIKVCEETGFDLPLLLAQMQCESNFGLNGKRCAETNSPFSVGLYDNGKNIVKYDSQDDAIDDYIRLMQRDYLVNGKTVDGLLTPGGFVNKNGYRYASDKEYENKVRATRNSIIRKYPELAS